MLRLSLPSLVAILLYSPLALASPWPLPSAASLPPEVLTLPAPLPMSQDVARPRGPIDIPSCDGSLADPPSLGDFRLGACWAYWGSSVADYMTPFGVNHTRTQVRWSFVHPTVDLPTLTMADVQANPALVEAWIANGDWTFTDEQHQIVIDAGATPIAAVGASWHNSLATINGIPATPDNLGKEEYIAQLYLHTRAVVERYDGDGYLDAPGTIVVKTWQVENELNQAHLEALTGLRLPTASETLISAWYDFDFLTDLLFALNQAVKDADPTALTLTNLHTDIPPELNHAMGLPSWIDSAALWRDAVDIMGFDAYPNYLWADPIGGEIIGERTQMIQEATCGMNVVVMETGYPAGPWELGFSEEGQGAYIREAVESGRGAGLEGLYYWKIQSRYTHDVVITEEDIAAHDEWVGYAQKEQVGRLLWWGVKYKDDLPHLVEVFNSGFEYYGLVDPEGSPGAGHDELVELVGEISP